MLSFQKPERNNTKGGEKEQYTLIWKNHCDFTETDSAWFKFTSFFARVCKIKRTYRFLAMALWLSAFACLSGKETSTSGRGSSSDHEEGYFTMVNTRKISTRENYTGKDGMCKKKDTYDD